MLSKDYSAEFKQRFADRYADGATITMPQHEFGLTKPTAKLWRERIDQGGVGAIDRPRENNRYPQEFKLRVVEAYLRGEGDCKALALEHGVRNSAQMTCIVFSDTHARDLDAFRMHSTTTERTVCLAKPSRQAHRRVQARDRRPHHLDGRADNGMLRRARPEFQDREQMGAEPPARACRRARPESRGPRASRGEKAHTRARDGERLPEKAAAFFAKSQAWPRATG